MHSVGSGAGGGRDEEPGTGGPLWPRSCRARVARRVAVDGHVGSPRRGLARGARRGGAVHHDWRGCGGARQRGAGRQGGLAGGSTDGGGGGVQGAARVCPSSSHRGPAGLWGVAALVPAEDVGSRPRLYLTPAWYDWLCGLDGRSRLCAAVVGVRGRSASCFFFRGWMPLYPLLASPPALCLPLSPRVVPNSSCLARWTPRRTSARRWSAPSRSCLQ